jgi:hypothetical protein
MAIESPIAIGVVSRMPDPKASTAAMLVMFSLALWIESPVIDLLATATTLGTSRPNYAVLSRFVWWLMGWVTLAHAALAFTPLFDVVAYRLMGLDRSVGELTRLGLSIMLPWSAAIGWRRYLQGILIRYGRTRLIGIGTGVRVVTMAGSSLTLFSLSTGLPAIAVAATSLIASVIAEALFIHWASRKTVREKLVELQVGEPPLTMRRLMSFHFPLTATTMVMMLGLPLVAAGIARAPDSILALAAWQVASTILFLARTVVFALPEVVIALVRDVATAETLRSFCLRVGAVTSSIVVLAALSGADAWFFRNVLRASPDVVDAARIAFAAGCLMPLLGAAQSYYRGLLTWRHVTAARLRSMLWGMATLFGAISVAVYAGWPGALSGAVAMTAGLAVELAVLAFNWRRVAITLPG